MGQAAPSSSLEPPALEALPRVGWWSRLADLVTWRNTTVGLVVVALGYLAASPLLLLLWGAFRSAPPGAEGVFTAEKIVEAYSDLAIYTSLFNTVIYSAGTVLVALTLGAFLAWVYERTDVPFRNLIYTLSIVRVIIPMMLAIIGWILLLSPTIGLINKFVQGLLGLPEAPFNIYSRFGMMWAEGIDLLPQGFLLSLVAFHSIDPALEEAAAVTGSSPVRTFWRITARLASPGLFAAALIVFLDAFQSIEVPALIGLRAGIPTLSTAVYEATEGTPSDINLASAYGAGFLVLAALGVFAYQRATARANRFATITGHGYRPRRIALGKWRYPVSAFAIGLLVLGFGLPILVLLWASLLPFYSAPSPEAFARISLANYKFIFEYPTTIRAISNSFVLAVSAATIASILTMVGAWLVVRSGSRLARALDVIVFLPMAFPGVVLGLSLLWLYITLPFNLYGTLWVIGIAYVTRFMPMGMRFSYAAIIQLRRELEEAAELAGGGWVYNFRRVIFPLVISGFVSSWIYIVAYSFRELSASILLSYSGTEVVAVTIFDLWNNGQTGPVAAFSIVILILLTTLVTTFNFLIGRLGFRPEH